MVLQQTMSSLVVWPTIWFWFICEPENSAECCVFPKHDLAVLAKIAARFGPPLTELVKSTLEKYASEARLRGFSCFERFYCFTS